MEARHARFLDLPVSGKGQMFKILDAETGEAIGSWAIGKPNGVARGL